MFDTVLLHLLLRKNIMFRNWNRILGLCNRNASSHRLNKLMVGSLALLVAVIASTEQSAQAQTRPAGGGGQDIIVFDIVDSVTKASRPAGGGGGDDIIVFDIIDSISDCRVMVLGESVIPGVYEVVVDMGDSIEFGLMWEVEPVDPEGNLHLGLRFYF